MAPLAFFIIATAELLIKALARPATNAWRIEGLKSVVTFGDSYTDEQRIVYFITHNGTAPPPGWVEPVVSKNLQIPSLYNTAKIPSDMLSRREVTEHVSLLLSLSMDRNSTTADS
jgi:hypothetical protein